MSKSIGSVDIKAHQELCSQTGRRKKTSFTTVRYDHLVVMKMENTLNTVNTGSIFLINVID